MNVLEKILEEMKKIKDGNRKEKLYSKYPAKNKRQEILNIYSQGHEDGTDNFYNAMDSFIRSRMDDANDINVPSNWIPCSERLPEEDSFGYIISCPDGIVRTGVSYGYAEGEDKEPCFYKYDDEYWNCYRYNDVVAWQPLPEPYK